MNLQQFLRIKQAAGEDGVINAGLKQLAKMNRSGGLFNMTQGHTYAAMKAGATPKQYAAARRGLYRRYDPNWINDLDGGMSYQTIQRGLVEEMTGGVIENPKAIGLSEGALGKILRDPDLFRKAYKKAPSLFPF